MESLKVVKTLFSPLTWGLYASPQAVDFTVSKLVFVLSELRRGWEAVRWDFRLPLKESMKLHISKTRHGTPYPLFKPVVLLHALALVVFLTQSHAMPWVGKYLLKKIQTKMLCSARVWEDICLRGLPGNAHQDLWVQRWCPPPYKLHRSVCILFIMLFFGFFLSVKIPF